MPPKRQSKLQPKFKKEDMTPKHFWKIRDEPYFSDKGLYIISTKSLARKHIYKVGYSGCSLKTRLSQFHEVLSPVLQESLLVYGVVIPKQGKSGERKNIRASDLNQLEQDIHEKYKGDRLKNPDNGRATEWIEEPEILHLYEVIDEILNNENNTYKIHFNFNKLQRY